MSQQQLSPQEVRRIAALARIAVRDDQIPGLQADLSAVLGYMQRLSELDLTGVEPLTHVSESAAMLGEDVPGPTLPNEALLSMAPAVFDRFVRIPRVFDDGSGA